jgi:hypothetical protein
MGIMQEIELGGLQPAWEMWRCTAGSCPDELLQVGRRSPGEDIWLFYERPGWVMAASEPVCPRCGMTMRREP